MIRLTGWQRLWVVYGSLLALFDYIHDKCFTVVAILVLLLSIFRPTAVSAQPYNSYLFLTAQKERPDLSGLTSDQASSIEKACSHKREFSGPAAYYGCLQDQLNALKR